MKIIQKSKMPDGTIIQIEDWREDYTHIKTLQIGAYPKAKNTSNNNIIEANSKFRLDLVGFKNNKEVEDIFNKLEKGIIKLEHLQEHFYSTKYRFYLGLFENE